MYRQRHKPTIYKQTVYCVKMRHNSKIMYYYFSYQTNINLLTICSFTSCTSAVIGSVLGKQRRKVDLDKKLKYLEIIVEHFFNYNYTVVFNL